MSNDFTKPIETGEITNVEDYIIRCAKVFCPFSFAIDEPIYTPIPGDIQPSAYYSIKLSESIKEFENLKNMSKDEIHAAHRQVLTRTYNYFMDSYEETMAKKKKYDAILEKLKAWNPVDESHKQLKEFAIAQIYESMPGEDHCNILLKTANEQMDGNYIRETDEEWYRDTLNYADSNVERYKRLLKEYEEKAKAANEWLIGVKESLKDIDI